MNFETNHVFNCSRGTNANAVWQIPISQSLRITFSVHSLTRSQMHKILGAQQSIDICSSHTQRSMFMHTTLFKLFASVCLGHDRHRIFGADAGCVDNGLIVVCMCVRTIANWQTGFCSRCCCPISFYLCEWAYGPFDLRVQKFIHAHNHFSFQILRCCWCRVRLSMACARVSSIFSISYRFPFSVFVVLEWEQWYQFKHSELCRNKVIRNLSPSRSLSLCLSCSHLLCLSSHTKQHRTIAE